MKVIVVKIDTSQPFSSFEQYLPQLSADRQQRIAALRRSEDKLTSFFAELLITAQLAERLGMQRSEVLYCRNDYGKPVIANIDDLQFSVSHSEGMIAFAESDRPIGIDIQHISTEPRSYAMRFFTEDEQRYIANSPEPHIAFFEVWTAKEAYVKLLGTGLSTPLRSFDVTDGSTGCCFYRIRADGCMMTICTQLPLNTKPEISRITPQELLDTLALP